MLLIDKYKDNYDKFIYYNKILNKITKYFNLNTDNPNFQNLILYSIPGVNKKYLITKLINKLYNKDNIVTEDMEYIINGYSNIKTKITIKQSKYHIVIDPTSNGFDKYIIHDIINEYTRSQVLNLVTDLGKYKIIVIDKIDDLNYHSQSALRRTMEKYSSNCRFILISEQLTKIINPITSRCILLKVPLPTDIEILDIIMHISYKENILLPLETLKNIIYLSENKINIIIWLLDAYKNTNNLNGIIKYDKIINDIVNLVININDTDNIIDIIKKCRENFYTLYITNIQIHDIIMMIMKKILHNIDNLYLKYIIINETINYEKRINKGKRYVIQFEAYIVSLLNHIYNHRK